MNTTVHYDQASNSFYTIEQIESAINILRARMPSNVDDPKLCGPARKLADAYAVMILFQIHLIAKYDPGAYSETVTPRARLSLTKEQQESFNMAMDALGDQGAQPQART